MNEKQKKKDMERREENWNRKEGNKRQLEKKKSGNKRGNGMNPQKIRKKSK